MDCKKIPRGKLKMNQLKTVCDFNYKHIKPTSSIYLKEKSYFIIPLWKVDRLSLIRATIFIEKFFNHIYIRKQTIYLKYSRIIKKKKTKMRLIIRVPIQDFNILSTLLTYMSIPRYLPILTGYLLIFHFNHFKLTIPVTIKNPILTYKLTPYLMLKK